MSHEMGDSPEPEAMTAAYPLDEMRAEIGRYLSGDRPFDNSVKRLAEEYLREIESELSANES